MLKLIKTKNLDAKSSEEILELYKAENWWPGPKNSERLQKIIDGSYIFLTAESEGRIVAMARAISDGVSDAYIQDVCVDREYRHQGIGKKIMEELSSLLFEANIEWVGLIAERQSNPFYEKLDFAKMPGSTPMLHKNTFKSMGIPLALEESEKNEVS